jgi:signal transduction histidine kinase
MSRRAVLPLAVLTSLAVLALIPGQALVGVAEGPDPRWLLYLLAPIVVAYAPLGALVVRRQPRNAVGWLIIAFALAVALQGCLSLYAKPAMERGWPGGETVAWISDWVFTPAFCILILFLPLLFPNGRPLSPRWRPLVAVDIALVVLTTVSLALSEAPITAYGGRVAAPLGVIPSWVNDAVTIPLAAATVAGVTSMLLRYRKASGDERLQLRGFTWFAGLGAGILLISLPLSVAGDTVASAVGDTGVYLLLLAPGAACVAVLRYRLYDVDLVLNRALAYGALTAIVVGAYVAVVALAGGFLGGSVGIAAAAVAAGIVAIAFDPLRVRLQRAANRMLYGERDDPGAAVAHLAEGVRAAVAPEEVLPAVVRTVGTALRLPYAAIEVPLGTGVEVVARYGQRPASGLERAPLRHAGRESGWLVIAPRPGGLDERDRRLLGDLAAHAGAAVDAVRLSAEIRASRRRLVMAREEERRALRRELHEELGPSLAALALALDAADRRLERDPDDAGALLGELGGHMQELVAGLRRVIEELGATPAPREAVAG